MLDAPSKYLKVQKLWTCQEKQYIPPLSIYTQILELKNPKEQVLVLEQHNMLLPEKDITGMTISDQISIL